MTRTSEIVKSQNLLAALTNTHPWSPVGVCWCGGMHMYECMSIFSSVEQDVGGQRGGSKVKAWLNNYQIRLTHLHTHKHTLKSFTTTWAVIFEMSGQCFPPWPLSLCTHLYYIHTLRIGSPSLSEWIARNTHTHTHNVPAWKLVPLTGYQSGNRGKKKEREQGGG